MFTLGDESERTRAPCPYIETLIHLINVAVFLKCGLLHNKSVKASGIISLIILYLIPV